MKDQVNMIPPKENNKAIINDSKYMEIYERSEKEFRIIILKKFSELQEERNRQLNEIRKTMHERNEKFNNNNNSNK